jgi:hypothetical protein
VLRNKRRILIGSDAYAIDLMQRLLPALYQGVVVLSMRLAPRFMARPGPAVREVSEQ